MIDSAEKWWESFDSARTDIRAIIKKFTPDMVGQFDCFADRRNYLALLSLMDNAWWEAPDHPSIHAIPGWGTLCDLCSECEVLNG